MSKLLLGLQFWTFVFAQLLLDLLTLAFILPLIGLTSLAVFIKRRLEFPLWLHPF